MFGGNLPESANVFRFSFRKVPYEIEARYVPKDFLGHLSVIKLLLENRQQLSHRFRHVFKVGKVLHD
jgi:hypothetical protein